MSRFKMFSDAAAKLLTGRLAEYIITEDHSRGHKIVCDAVVFDPKKGVEFWAKGQPIFFYNIQMEDDATLRIEGIEVRIGISISDN